LREPRQGGDVNGGGGADLRPEQGLGAAHAAVLGGVVAA